MLRLATSAFLIALAAPAAAQTGEPLREQIRQAMQGLVPSRDEDPRRVVDHGLFLHHPPMLEAMSADERWFVSHDEDGALRVREAGGESVVIATADGSFRWTVEGARLSRDGRWIAAKMFDDSMVYAYTLGDATGGKRTVRFSYAGQPIPEKRLFVISRSGNTRFEVPLTMDYIYLAGFDSDGRGLRYVEANRVGRHVVLRHFDLDTGEISTLMDEQSNDWTIAGYDLGDFYSTRFEGSNRLLIVDDNRFLWKSDRSGRSQLYAYYDGLPPRALSLPRDEILLDVVGIDRDAQVAVIKTGVGDATWAPHRLRAVDLGTLETRTILDAPYMVFNEMAPGGVMAAISGVPATTILRWVDYEGNELKPDMVADLSFIERLSLSIEQLELPGAEGDMLRAVLVTPKGDGPFPLVDYLYGGPQAQMAEPDPLGRNVFDAMEMARRGIATVIIDARGTPGRGAEFAHAQDGRFGAPVIPDHVAAIRALLAQNDRLDPDRVGIMGHSWGGYFALRGMIEGNELYKAGIMLAPNTNVSEMRVPVEAYQGCLPVDCPEAYAQGHMTSRLDELRGPLLVIHGAADDDVLPEVTDRLEADLEAVGADYEIVRPPNAHHIVQREPDYIERITDFWKRTLAD